MNYAIQKVSTGEIDDLEWAVQYALMQGCFFPVPFPGPPYRVEDLRKWGAMRHLHDVIARYPFRRDFSNQVAARASREDTPHE